MGGTGSTPPLLIVRNQCNWDVPNLLFEFYLAWVLILLILLTCQTIGPQCAGKTTYLKNLVPEGVEDVSTDDVPQVYEKVPVKAFTNRILNPDDNDSYVDRRSYGISLLARIDQISNEEQGLLCLLFTGENDYSEIETRLLAALPDEGNGRIEFLAALKSVLAKKYTMVRNWKNLLPELQPIDLIFDIVA